MKKETSGFSLENFFQRLTFNLISRIIGFFARSILITWGLLFALFFFVLGLPVFFIWQFLPPLSWFLFLQTRKDSPLELKDCPLRAKKFAYQRLGVKSEEELRKIQPEDIKAVLKWYLEIKTIKLKKLCLWEKENLFRLPSLGSDLAFGYTPELDKYCQNLSFPPSFAHQLVGRKKEIREIEAVLSRSAQTNVLLVGEPGVGRHTIILGLAKAIREKRVGPSLFFKRVLLLDMNLILGKSGLTAQSKATFSLLLKRAEAAGNLILVISQIEKYVSGEIGVDLTAAFAQIVRSAKVQIIGITTPEHFEKFIFPNEQFLKYFEKVEALAPGKEEALHILQRILPGFEKRKKVITTYQALKEIIDQSAKFITHIPFPEKAIDLLDQLIAEAHSSGRPVITQRDVDELISQKVKVPIGSLSRQETEKLKNLDSILHRRIVNQNQAVNALVKAMQRTRVGITEEKKPMGAFLFLGPTGVGKTETAKALAEAYFGDEKQMVRFDMSQPFNLDLFVKEARERPYAVCLLDEFEKASIDTVHLFLTVFDEGYLKDKEGKIVSFKNMVIICTSNAGSEFIRERVRAGVTPSEIIEHVLKQGIFSPELINRFDGVIVYRPLEKAHISQIAKMMIKRLALRLEKKGIVLDIDPLVYDLIAQKGHSAEFGARPMKRLIADKIESLIAEKILHQEIRKTDKIKLTLDSKTKEFKIEKYG